MAKPDGEPVKPWPHADTWPVARLEVPHLGIDQIVLAGASGRTLAFGPAHLGMSAAPGRPGNTVISGHRDTHFSFLNHLQPGDGLSMMTRDGRRLEYEVAGIAITHIDDISIELVTPRRQITLVTCYPFNAINPGTPFRYVVTATLVEERGDLVAATKTGSGIAARGTRWTSGQPSVRTQEPESYGPDGGAFASAPDTGYLGLVQEKGGLPGWSAPPRWQGAAGNAEAFSNPREKDRLAGGRLVSQSGL